MSAHEDRTTTRVLIDGYLAGDRAAERRLFEAHRKELVERAASMRWLAGLASEGTPEDLVDEVFLRVLRTGLLRRFEDRGRGSLARILNVILDDVAVDAYRRCSAAKRSGGGEPPKRANADSDPSPGSPWIPSQEPTPTSNARATELLELSCQLLEPHEWEVWRLLELEGLDSEAAAQRLGTTAAAVRGTFRRARLRIVHALSHTQTAVDPDHP